MIRIMEFGTFERWHASTLRLSVNAPLNDTLFGLLMYPLPLRISSHMTAYVAKIELYGDVTVKLP